MSETIEWLRMFVSNYPALKYMLVFLGAAFGGELALISLSFLAAKGAFSLNLFFLMSFLGTFSSDILWFFLGKTKAVERASNHRFAKGTVDLITDTIQKVSRGNHFLALLLAKVMVGTRVIFLMYVGRTNLSFNKFFPYDAFSVIFWLLIVIPIGYVAGLGFDYLSDIFENIYAGIGFLLLFTCAIVMTEIWLKRKFTKAD